MLQPRYIVLFFILFTCGFGFSQTKNIDSLVHLLNSTSNSSEKIARYLTLFEQHQSIEKDSLFKYAIRAKTLAVNSNKNAQTLVNIALINAYYRFDKFDSALLLTNIELKKYSVKDQSAIYKRLLTLKCYYYMSVSDYKEANAILYTIIDLAEKEKDTITITACFNFLGEIDYNRNLVSNAKQWHYKALSLSGNNPTYNAQKAVAYINLGNIYNWIKQLDSAKYCVEKAIPICNKIENLYYLCNAYMVLSGYYRHSNNFEAAEKMMLKAMDIRKKTEGKIVFSNEQLALGNLYYHIKKFNKAIEVFKSGIAYDDSINNGNSKIQLKKSNLVIRYYYLQGLMRCYKATNLLDTATILLEEMLELTDSIGQINAADALADMQVKYETQKKENTIIQQKFDINRKNILFYFVVILLSALAIIFGIIFWNYKKKQELKLQQQIEKDKWHTLQAIAKAEENERSRIAADLHDNLGVYAASIASNLQHIKLCEYNAESEIALSELNKNSQAIVSQLNDTIWILKKKDILLTAISDRIKVLLNKTQKSFPNIQFNIQENIERDVEFSAIHAYHLYRILQEAINNALKHSKCSQIDIEINSTNSWSILIKDNGIGFLKNKEAVGGNGIKNMETRSKEANWKIHWTSDKDGSIVTITPTTN